MLLSTMLTTLLATLVIAYPDPTPQGYSGPCEVDNCGVSGSKCSAGRLCVGWPNVNPALRKGCTCSSA
ncbi:hypothetical protein PTTW11_07060 [Pyrenophora teres f. teres]|uniref:Uncharacterized protein n=1 Tax=Pyrenophora teres f. teres TaxID=97479 RepID=A0A6S6W5V5_9PLEO|nr:hypothetical protein HRS9122_09233 [Pyrenophora teres f. teres]KAE8857242.1 hypothetical protein PTNB29_08309 [Pyrenophora teres f. teres]CAA9963117.1 hypothetical protein PTMSG1_06485 [Pyrenophora teres f. maculata]CAE7186962.1 hypothetical protein PTTW11_07060 [Pyrenophora teres f. teres]